MTTFHGARSIRAEEHEATLPDPKAIACIVDEVRSMEFPRPDGGIVTVVYPISFSPGDDRKP
jgi:hypothetical protein